MANYAKQFLKKKSKLLIMQIDDSDNLVISSSLKYIFYKKGYKPNEC